MSDLTVITSVYGDDALVDPPAQDLACEWVCVTDRPRESDVWNVIVEPRPHMHPRHAAKIAKYRPDRYCGTSMSLWLDGSVRLQTHDAVRHLSELTRYGAILSMLPHPDRNTIRDEAPQAQAQHHYTGQMLIPQSREYTSDMGVDDDSLWATTVIGRHHDPLVCEWGDMVLLETLFWSLHDPLVVPYAAWILKVSITPINEHLWTTPHFTLWQRPIPSI